MTNSGLTALSPPDFCLNHCQGHPEEFAALKKCDHPILSKLEDLLALAKSSDLVTLTRIMCVFGMTLDDQKAKRCRLQEAQKRLEQYRAEEAREKGQPQVQEKGNAGEELPPQPPETPLPTSTLAVPTSSSAVEMSAPQPCDSTTTPPPEDGSVATSPPETPAWVDTSTDEACETIDDILIALEEHVQVYLRDKNIFKRFNVVSHKSLNELRITVQSR